MLGDPNVPRRRIFGQGIGELRGELQLLLQKRPRKVLAIVIAQQRFIDLPDVPGGVHRMRLARRSLQVCQDSHGKVLGRLAGRCSTRLYSSREAAPAKNSIDVKIARTDGRQKH
jgi:hypothetical protein